MKKKEENNQEKQENTNFQFIINAQYLKDLSFENPNAPDSLKQFEEKPEIKINVDINTCLLYTSPSPRD